MHCTLRCEEVHVTPESHSTQSEDTQGHIGCTQFSETDLGLGQRGGDWDRDGGEEELQPVEKEEESEKASPQVSPPQQEDAAKGQANWRDGQGFWGSWTYPPRDTTSFTLTL